MSRQHGIRQSVRKGLILVSFLLFPITMNYLSPYVVIDGASQGILNGSPVMFGLMFLSALFLGRLWCGWICPAGGLAEMSIMVNDRRITNRKLDWIKWFIWIPWLLLIAATVIMAGGYRTVDLLLDTQGGISVAGAPDRPILIAYIIYYGVIALFLSLSLFVGKRAGCHTICWMAPFMILGRKARNLFNWPALRLKATPETCSNCKTCTSRCPMSLDVNGMVKQGWMENSECILCGTCVDNCPTRTIRYAFSKSEKAVGIKP